MGGGIEYLSVARPSPPTRKDRRDRQRPSATSRATRWGRGDPVSEKQLVCSANCCFNSYAELSHKDSVRKATVEEQLSSKTKHPALTAQLHLPPLDLSWAPTLQILTTLPLRDYTFHLIPCQNKEMKGDIRERSGARVHSDRPAAV